MISINLNSIVSMVNLHPPIKILFYNLFLNIKFETNLSLYVR